MPFDPSLPLKVEVPQIEGPFERYGRMMTLRDMMDQRRVRASQVRRLEMQEQESLREQEEYNRFRQALPTLNEKSTLTDYLTAGGTKYGLPVYKARQEALEAQGKAEKEALEAEVKRDLLFANKAEGYLWQDDPAERQRMWGTDTPDFLKLGLITPEQAAAPQFDDEYLEAIVARGKGREYLVKLQGDREKRKEERTKAALEQSKQQIELAGYYAGTVKDQPSYERWTSMLPKELRTVLDKDYTPEGMARAQSAMLTAQQRVQQAEQAQPNTVGDYIRIATDPSSSREDQERADKALTMFSTQAKAGAGTTVIGPHQKVGDEAKLRDDFRQESKTYTIVRDAYTKIKGAAESQTGPGDISLLYGYMRMLDPGSTVREGEFATAQNAGGVPERIRAYWNKLLTGERLEPGVRAQFVSEAEKIYGQSFEDHRKIRDRYRDITVRSGLDPENVVVDYSPAEVSRPAAPRQAAPSGQPAAAPGGIPSPIVGVTVTTPNGRTYVFPDAAAAELFKKRTGIK